MYMVCGALCWTPGRAGLFPNVMKLVLKMYLVHLHSVNVLKHLQYLKAYHLYSVFNQVSKYIYFINKTLKVPHVMFINEYFISFSVSSFTHSFQGCTPKTGDVMVL